MESKGVARRCFIFKAGWWKFEFWFTIFDLANLNGMLSAQEKQEVAWAGVTLISAGHKESFEVNGESCFTHRVWKSALKTLLQHGHLQACSPTEISILLMFTYPLVVPNTRCVLQSLCSFPCNIKLAIWLMSCISSFQRQCWTDLLIFTHISMYKHKLVNPILYVKLFLRTRYVLMTARSAIVHNNSSLNCRPDAKRNILTSTIINDGHLLRCYGGHCWILGGRTVHCPV